MNKPTFNATSIVDFKPGASFSERESAINNEILKINDTLRKRGFYPINHNIANKTSTKATIIVSYST